MASAAERAAEAEGTAGAGTSETSVGKTVAVEDPVTGGDEGPELQPKETHEVAAHEVEATPGASVSSSHSVDRDGQEWPTRVARQDGERQGGERPIAAEDSGVLGGVPDLEPERFHDTSYGQVIRRLGLRIIDEEGPVTFEYLATRIARTHGFKRTGGQIRRTVEQALTRQRPESRGPDQKKIYWPVHAEPQQVIPYRGLFDGKGARTWADVPDPERLGLARQVLAGSRPDHPEDDPAAAMADVIGLTRLRQTTREEFEVLLRRAGVMGAEGEVE